MAEQQYRVIADRDKGDDPQEGTILVGDRYTFESVSNEWVGGDTDVLVRIERPAPTTDEPSEQWTPSTAQVRSHYVFDQSNRWDAERGAAFDRWLTSVSSPPPPTREQIAEVLRESDPEGAAEVVDFYYTQADALLALIQNGTGRG